MHYKRIQEEKSKIKDRDLVRLYLAEKQEEKKKTEKVQQQKRKTRPLAQVKKKNMSKDEAKRERVNTILQEALTGKRKGSKTYKKIEKEGFFQYITMVSRQETFRSKAKRFFFVTGFICLFFLIFLLTNIIMHLVLEYLKRN
jgi:ATP phosphoribosyltransferase